MVISPVLFGLFILGVIGYLVWRGRIDKRLNDLEIRFEKLLAHVGFEADSNPPVTEDVALLARTPGAKVIAIKTYMRQTGAGLREAKAEVERLAGSRPQ